MRAMPGPRGGSRGPKPWYLRPHLTSKPNPVPMHQNDEENVPLALANMVSRGYTLHEARRQLGLLPKETPEAPAPEAPAPEAPAPEAPVAKKFPFKKGAQAKSSPANGL